MDFKSLRSFLHVVDLGSLSRAAQRLHLSQPALSRQIKLLEDDLGTPLLVRTGRGVVATDAGRTLAERVRPLLAELEDVGNEIAAQRDDPSGKVALAAPPGVGPGLLADLVEACRDRHPRIRLRVAVLLSGAIRDAILAGRLDLGLIYHPLSAPSLATEPLWREALWLVGPAAALPPDPVPFPEALARPLVLPGPRHGLRAVVEAYALRQGLAVEVAVEVESLQVQLELVRRGVGFTLLPERALGGPGLTAVPVIEPTLERTTALAWPRDRRMSAAAGAVAALVRATQARVPSASVENATPTRRS